MPAAVIGGLFDKKIERYLFGLWPVAAAWLVGGVLVAVIIAALVVTLSGAMTVAKMSMVLIRMIEAGGKSFVFSGDTAWTDALLDISADADLFVCECHSMSPKAPGHMDWPRLRENLPRMSARKFMITHMGPEVLANLDAIRAESGVDATHDGLVVTL